jgi:hypothetical protein
MAEKVNYKGFTVELGEMDNLKCNDWKKHHWKCIMKDPVNRTQMSFDIFGASLVTRMQPLEAVYLFISDACAYMNVYDIEDVMNEFGYEDYKTAKQVYNGLEKAYYKCRKFIGSDNDILEIADELREEWG